MNRIFFSLFVLAMFGCSESSQDSNLRVDPNPKGSPKIDAEREDARRRAALKRLVAMHLHANAALASRQNAEEKQRLDESSYQAREVLRALAENNSFGHYYPEESTKEAASRILHLYFIGEDRGDPLMLAPSQQIFVIRFKQPISVDTFYPDVIYTVPEKNIEIENIEASSEGVITL